MAAVARDPLASRPLAPQVSPTPPYSASVRKTSSAKRARSPDPSLEHSTQSAKRPKPDNPATTREETKREKERKRAEREREFRDKYTRAFPQWRFHFDADLLTDEETRLKDSLVTAVSAMGAVRHSFPGHQPQLTFCVSSAWKSSSPRTLRTLLYLRMMGHSPTKRMPKLSHLRIPRLPF